MHSVAPLKPFNRQVHFGEILVHEFTPGGENKVTRCDVGVTLSGDDLKFKPTVPDLKDTFILTVREPKESPGQINFSLANYYPIKRILSPVKPDATLKDVQLFLAKITTQGVVNQTRAGQIIQGHDRFYRKLPAQHAYTQPVYEDLRRNIPRQAEAMARYPALIYDSQRHPELLDEKTGLNLVDRYGYGRFAEGMQFLKSALIAASK